MQREHLPVLQPVERRRVHLDQAPETFASLPSPELLRRLPCVRIRRPGLLQNTADALGTYGQTVVSFEEFLHVRQTRSSVFPHSFVPHQRSRLLGKRVRRLPAPIPVDQGGHIRFPDLRFQTEDVSFAQLETGRSFRRRHLSFHDPVQNHRFRRFFQTQENIAPHHSLRMTDDISPVPFRDDIIAVPSQSIQMNVAITERMC